MDDWCQRRSVNKVLYNFLYNINYRSYNFWMLVELLKDPIWSISIYVTKYLLGQNTDKTNIDSILHIPEQLYGHVVVREQQT